MTTPEYKCHVTGREVQPLGVGDVQTVRGVRYAWWFCPACDVNERTRSMAGFDATLPGCHVVFFDPIPERGVWQSRWTRLEVSR